MRMNHRHVGGSFARDRATTHEGGPAQPVGARAELRRTVLACLLWEDAFYEDGIAIGQRIRDLVARCEPRDVIDLAIEAREKMYLRHVPLLLVRELARRGPILDRFGHSLIRSTLARVIQRVDELTEFLAIYYGPREPRSRREPLTAGVKKGLADALRKFDRYQLAKYNRDGQYKLSDVVRLAARADLAKSADLRDLLAGKLEAPDTWEVALSAGKEPAKEVWVRLLAEKRLGGLALLRNLRNMDKVGVPHEVIFAALDAARFPRVLPFRFVTAASVCPWAEEHLDQALIRTLDGGRPSLDGHTVTLVDVSGSMEDPLSAKSKATRMDAAAALAIYMREVAETGTIVTFSQEIVSIPPRRGMALRDAIVNSQHHGGTYLGNAIHALYQRLPNVKRVIVITDEQTADRVPACPWPLGYMINVATNKHGVSYGNGWRHVDGWSEHVIRYVAELEADETGRQVAGSAAEVDTER